MSNQVMAADSKMRRLRCPACGWQRPCGVEEMLRRLRTLGMLRREAQPHPTLILELLQSQSSSLTCDECQEVGLLLEDADDDFDDSGAGRLCEMCGRPLAAERLQLYPDARRCAACEQIDMHSAFYDSELAQLGSSLQLLAGGTVHLPGDRSLRGRPFLACQNGATVVIRDDQPVRSWSRVTGQSPDHSQQHRHRRERAPGHTGM